MGKYRKFLIMALAAGLVTALMASGVLDHADLAVSDRFYQSRSASDGEIVLVGIDQKTLEDILDLHQRFEMIHLFQDGNGRVGRLVIFKECLANGIVPFIITDDLKMFYYRGLQRWPEVREYLTDTCLTAQDNYKAILDYFKIEY